jgi:hypothetical protein
VQIFSTERKGRDIAPVPPLRSGNCAAAPVGMTEIRSGKPLGRVGASQEAETGVLDGGAKFAGTCPLVQVILAGANERRGFTQPSGSRGVEPECQM